MEPTNVEISLHVEISGDELRGSACCAGDPEREFCGWIGLIATIDELVAGAQVSSPARGPAARAPSRDAPADRRADRP